MPDEYSRQEENFRGTSKRKPRSSHLPGTKPGTTATQEAADTADLAEIARVLASLTPEERSALLAAVSAAGTRQRQHNPVSPGNGEVPLTGWHRGAL
jgi:hypothetical protein